MNSKLTQLLLLLLLLTGCKSDDKETATPEPTMLSIYVYSPEHPVATRTESSATDAENAVHTIQLWVFRQDTQALVAYLNPDAETLNSGGATYEVPVDDNFAITKPPVNVYVLINGAAAGAALTQTSTQTQVEAAVISGNEATGYSPASLQTAVSSTLGLPMSGVLKSQPIVDSRPVLRIGTEDQIARVRVARAVSKVQFAFARPVGSTEVKITSITMNDAIPQQTYLLPTAPYDGTTASIPTGATYDAVTLPGLESITVHDNPSSIQLMEGDELEEAVAQQTSKLGPYYLRESDKKITGTIKYKVGTDAEKTANFAMADAGGFSRNHSWVVYAYYSGSDQELKVMTLQVRNWNDSEKEYEIYNW